MIQGIIKKISVIGVLAFICFLMGQNTASAQILPIPNYSFSCASNAVAPLESIKDIQTYLNCNGFNPGPIDGDFGNRTTSAIKAFQAASGLVS
jgi:peptidoglycan hydrolase-like protein with peptidoglycan-binding domain